MSVVYLVDCLVVWLVHKTVAKMAVDEVSMKVVHLEIQ